MFDDLVAASEALDEALSGLDPRCAVGRQAGVGVALIVAMERRLAAKRLAFTARAEQQHPWEREGFRSFEEWLAAAQGTGTGQARRKAATARSLGGHDDVADALADGEISEEQADVVADAADKNPAAEKDLVDTAKNKNKSHKDLQDQAARSKASAESDDERARRLRRGRSAGWGLDREGFWTLRGKFEPHVGAELKRRLSAETDAIFDTNRKAGLREPHPDRYRADAVAALILAGRNQTPDPPATSPDCGDPEAPSGVDENVDQPSRPAPKDLVLDINLEAYRRRQLLSGETCEIRGVGPVPVEIARQWADDTFIKVVLHDGTDIKLISHLGRNINAELKTALDFAERTCAVPLCDNPRLEYDHHQRVEHHGPTSWANLRRPCHDCHQLITHKGYRLEGDRGDRIWIHPDGRIIRADDPDRVGEPAPPPPDWPEPAQEPGPPPSATRSTSHGSDPPQGRATDATDPADQLTLLAEPARAP